MAKLMQAPDGRVFREVPGGWQELTGDERGGALAGANLGAGEAFAVGAGRELTRLGRGAKKLFAGIMGDDATRARLQDAERQESAIMSGTKEAAGTGASAAMFAGEIAPSLAMLPLGLGIGGARLAGGRALAEQTALGGALGGLGYSGDQGVDAMAGAMLSAAGMGVGTLAGKVANVIGNRGIAARAAIMDQAAAARIPPAAGAEVGAEGLEALQLGQAARPGAEAVMQAGRPVGAIPGAASENAARSGIIQRAEGLGLKFTDAQKSGDTVALQLEDGFRANPWTSGKFARQMEDNAKVLNRKAAESIGERADNLAPEVIDRAHARIGSVFEEASAAIGTISGESRALQKASGELDRIIDDSLNGGVLVQEAAAIAERLKGRWSGGQVTGAIIQGERRKLTNAIQKASREGDGNMVEALSQITRVVDDVIADSLPRKGAGGVILAQLKDARHEFRNLAVLQNANAISPTGNVLPGRAFEGFRKNFPLEMKRGRSGTDYGASVPGGAGMQLMDMVRAAHGIPNVVGAQGGSPTATRMSIQGLLTNPKDTIIQAGIMRAAEPLLMGAPGQLAAEIARTQGVAGAGQVGAATGRLGIMGGP